jgi:transcription antitermination factor NusG
MAHTQFETFSQHVSVGVRMPQWYAVQTRSRFEKTARAEMALQGIEHYLPTFEALHQWKDRKKAVELPLFSGYIFARFEDVGPGRLQVLKTVGVTRILGVGGAILPIPDYEIGSIRQLLSTSKRCFPHPFVREGAWVRVRRGPLAGIEGRLVRVKSAARLVLSVDLLSQSVATELDAQDIEPAQEPQRSRRAERF